MERFFSKFHSVKKRCSVDNPGVNDGNKNMTKQVAFMLLIRPLGNSPGSPERKIRELYVRLFDLKLEKAASPFIGQSERKKVLSFTWFVSLWMNQANICLFNACTPELQCEITITLYHVLESKLSRIVFGIIFDLKTCVLRLVKTK